MGWPPGDYRVSRFIAFFKLQRAVVLDQTNMPLVSILSGKLFSLNYFSVTVLVSGHSLGWFPRFRVAMDTSLQPMEFGIPLTFKVPIVHF